MSYVLGIDTSTTATKAVLVDGSGKVAAVSAETYGYETPQPLWSEQDPARWLEATGAAVRGALESAGISGSAVEAVGLTGQMHGLVVLDADGGVLRPAILWNDQRTAAECDEMRFTIGPDRLIQITGNDALTGFTAPKLLWLRNHEPGLFASIRHVLLPKDYVRWWLTGEYAMDRAGGGGTQLFDLSNRTWSAELLESMNLPEEWFPPTFEGTSITGTITGDAAAATGLAAGTPVVAGGGDQAANAVGTGALDPGVVTLSLGTSGVVFAATETPAYEPSGRVHAFPHAVPGRWHLMGVMLSAAGSLRWHRDTLAPGVSFAELDREAQDIAAGSDGLLFLPYLTGERTPHPDPLARAAFVGLTVRHGRPHMTRAVLEGVAFGLADGLDLMRRAGVAEVDHIRASGGGINSPLWRQILADVLGAGIATVNTTEGAAYGAAILAAAGVDWATVAELCDQWIETTSVTAPGPDLSRYRELHAVYQGLYPALRPTFTALG
ncbi:MAG: xylulokinase [Acidimicrobiia bacterium]|nr:xylulokinase [Acidimicrobiia bacterium]